MLFARTINRILWMLSAGSARFFTPRIFAACTTTRIGLSRLKTLSRSRVRARRHRVTADEIHVLALFDKPDPLDGPFFEETIYVTPSRTDTATQNAIRLATEQSGKSARTDARSHTRRDARQ